MVMRTTLPAMLLRVSLLVAAARAELYKGKPKPEYTALQTSGRDHLAGGNVTAALADLRAAVDVHPNSEPFAWEIGVALYYAEDFAGAAAHFALMHAKSPNAEAVVWHGACRDRLKPAPRPAALDLGDAKRDPFLEQVVALFAAGSDDEKAKALAAVEAETIPPSADIPKNAKNRVFERKMYYAHLYLALYFDGADAQRSKWHARLATRSAHATNSRKEDYEFYTKDPAGRVADTHAKLRGADLKPQCPCADAADFRDLAGEPCSANAGADCVAARNAADPEWADAYALVIDACPRTCGLCAHDEGAPCPEPNAEFEWELAATSDYLKRAAAAEEAYKKKMADLAEQGDEANLDARAKLSPAAAEGVEKLRAKRAAKKEAKAEL